MRPLVVRVEDSQTRRATTHTFTSSPVHVGRSDLNDLALTQPFVSLWHAIFWFDDAKVQCADLGSTNGTQLGEVPLTKGVRTELKQGAALKIGSLTISFTRELPSGNLAPPEPLRRQTMFGSRVGAPPPGSTQAFDPQAMGVIPVTPDRLPTSHELVAPGTSTAVTILHDGPLGSLPAAGQGTPVLPLAGVPAAPLSTATPITKFVPSPKPLAVPPASASEAVLQVVSQTAAPYMDFRHAWRAVLDQIRQGFAQLPEGERAQAASLLQTRFPALVHEEEFQSLVRGSGGSIAPVAQVASLPPPPVAESNGLGNTPFARTMIRGNGAAVPAMPVPIPLGAPMVSGAATQLLTQFAQSYAPTARPLIAPAEIEAFLDRLAALLETFANAFIELRKGKDQFEKEAGVSLSGAKGALKRAKNVEEVLRYLLEMDDGNLRKPEELIRGFAEVMIHHVALLNGFREGARGLLARLSPQALDKPETGARTEKQSAAQQILSILFPTRARWKRFLQRHQALLEEEGLMTQALFGPEFARAYTSVASDSVDAEPAKGGAPS